MRFHHTNALQVNARLRTDSEVTTLFVLDTDDPAWHVRGSA
jgi:hypothetical protein